ncbi:hypothetical protein IJI31_07455 [bacterium]|nr:hypothetical protein [bacterium]
MYIFELLFKLLSKKGKKNKDLKPYNPLDEQNQEDDGYCEHSFMPVDSTGETLACIKCGFIVKREDIKTQDYRNE